MLFCYCISLWTPKLSTADKNEEELVATVAFEFLVRLVGDCASAIVVVIGDDVRKPTTPIIEIRTDMADMILLSDINNTSLRIL
jgi:hypothetical protein